LNKQSDDHRSPFSEGAVLGDGLGAFADGVLGEFTWEDELDGGLDLSGGESVSLVVADEAGGFAGNLLEDVVDEGVHDAHGSLGDTGVLVDLLEDSVDVHREGLSAAASVGGLLGGGASLLASGGGFAGFCHFGLIMIKHPLLK